MSLYELIHEFLFDCKVRELSDQTIINYDRQLHKFRSFVKENFQVIQFEDLKPIHVKQYVSSLQDRGCKPAYTNDMLKAVKCLCSYAQREGYSEDILTKRVKNVKQPKVLIHTFSTKEISLMIKYFNGSDYMSVRNILHSTATWKEMNLCCLFFYVHRMMQQAVLTSCCQ